MINASLDATAAAMSWTLFLVAKHAAVQERLRQEIERGVVDSRKWPRTMSNFRLRKWSSMNR